MVNPATQRAIAAVPHGTAADVDLAAQAAAKAFERWSRTSVDTRAALFRTLAELVGTRAEEITRIIVSEVGHPISLARQSQTLGAVDELRVIADCLKDILWSEQLGNAQVRREPAGVVTTELQRERVRQHIQSAVAAQVRLLAGGAQAPAGLDVGYFVQPTVLSSDNQAKIAREEVFGPVLVIIPFDDELDAIRIANDSPYGLAGGVWSADVERARHVASRLRMCRGRVNGAPLNKLAPHGGFKLSGVGREWGRFGIEEFLEYQSVIG